MTLELRAVDAATTRPLRREVLRPHQVAETIVYDAEDDPSTLHIGAFLDGEMVGTATIHPDGPEIHRVRGMAVREGFRDRGIGGLMLERCIEHAIALEAERAWCNARLAAIPFYSRHGFVEVGERFEIPEIGPHVRMERVLR